MQAEQTTQICELIQEGQYFVAQVTFNRSRKC